MPQEIRLVAYSNAETVGGAERCLATILAGLPPSFRVTVVATDAAVSETVAAGCADAEITSVQPPKRFWDAGAVIAHRRVLERLDPHVCLINLQTPYCALHAALAAVLIPRLRVVAIEHLPLPSRSRAAHWLKRMTSRRLAAHVAVSAHTADAIAAEAGIARERMLVVRNGVSEPATGRSDLGLPRPIVGGMGRFDRQKGFDVLIDALAILRDISAVVAGDGPERDALVRRVRDRSLTARVSIVPWTSDIGPFLRSLDLFVLPSRYEGLPLALLEAMATGAAVVAADVGAVREAVVSGKNGLLVPPDDASALAAGISRLLDDEPTRRRLGSQARVTWQSEFTAERMQRRYVDLFAKLTR
jgi:glycosyltransferase involved in cell wall biosynthesis